jgi:hypothetical protein
MTPETRNSIVLSRSADYFGIMRTSIFTFAVIAAVIELGSGGYSAPLTMLVVGTAAFGILAGGTALDDIINLRDDMDDATAKTSYGKGVKARNIPALKNVSAALMALIGLAELYAIFT